MNNNSPVPEHIKEALNPNYMTMQDLIDDDNLPSPSINLTYYSPNKTIHHEDEDILLAIDDLSEDKNMRPPEDKVEELLESILA